MRMAEPGGLDHPVDGDGVLRGSSAPRRIIPNRFFIGSRRSVRRGHEMADEIVESVAQARDVVAELVHQPVEIRGVHIGLRVHHAAVIQDDDLAVIREMPGVLHRQLLFAEMGLDDEFLEPIVARGIQPPHLPGIQAVLQDDPRGAFRHEHDVVAELPQFLPEEIFRGRFSTAVASGKRDRGNFHYFSRGKSCL